MREIYNVKKEIGREPLSESITDGARYPRNSIGIAPANPNISPISVPGAKPRVTPRGKAERSLRQLPPKNGPLSSTKISVKEEHKENA